MKVLFDYSIFYHQKYGGISRYFINLQHQYLKNNINTEIFAPIHSNIYLKDNEKRKFPNFYFKNYPLFTRKIFKSFNQYSSNFFLNFYKPDIIHKTYYGDYQISQKCKKVMTVYDLIHEIYHNDYEKDKNYRPKEKSLNDVDRIICISNKTKKDLINIYKIDEKKIDVIYLGIQKFSDFKLREENQLKKPFLLYVGDRGIYKNFKNFIKAYSISSKLKNDFNIICCGGGKITDQEKKFILDNNIGLSKIDQIDASEKKLSVLYKNASALIYPSLYEGFGLPTLEAMSLSCPVVSSNHEAILEAVGDAAKIFNPNNFEEIKNCIEEVVYSNEQTEILRKKGLERIKNFSWEKCAEETLKTYDRIK